MYVTRPWMVVNLDEQPEKIHLILMNNAFIRKSTTNYTLDSVKGSPYTLSSDGRNLRNQRSKPCLCVLTSFVYLRRSNPGCFNSRNTMTAVGAHINSTHQAKLFISAENDAVWKFMHDSGRWPCFACNKSWSYRTAHCTGCHAPQIQLPARPAPPEVIIVGEVEDHNILCERYLQKCVDLPPQAHKAHSETLA
jgi:hypothetical protein